MDRVPSGSSPIGLNLLHENYSFLTKSSAYFKPRPYCPASMAGPAWKNTYRLSEIQLEQLDSAESLMESMDLGQAEELLVRMLEEDPICIPVLSNLGHLYGRYLSEFEKAVEYYGKVLELEPDNAWARDERRRYQRYLTYDDED